MTRTPPAKIEAVTLPWRVKIGFGISGIGRMISSVLVTTYVFYFYTEILLIPSSIATTVTLIGRIWAWFCDPTMGTLIDHASPNKEGKTRHIIKLCAIPAGILLFLTFAVPNAVGGVQAIWIGVTYLLQATINSLITVSLNTLMSRVTSDKVQRTHLNQCLTIFSTVTSLSFTAFTLDLVTSLGGGDMKKGFMFCGALYGLIQIITFLSAAIATKGYEPVETVVNSSGESVVLKGPGFGAMFKAMAQNKVWLFAILIYVWDTTGSMMQAQTMVSYFQHVLGNTGYLKIYSSVSMVITIASYLSLGFLTKRFGNAGTSLLGCVISIVGNLFRFFTHDANATLFTAGLVISMAGASLVAGTIVLCIMDTQVYGEWKTGVRNEAILMSGFGLSGKIGLALGGALAGYLQTFMKYDPSLGAPSEAVKQLFFYENTICVAIGFALSAVFAILVLKYEKKIPQMQAEIDARKAAANQYAHLQAKASEVF